MDRLLQPGIQGMDIIIVGAGLGGLTAALALQKAGLRPRVMEQAPALGDVGAGISVTPNASKGLISLGLYEGLERHGQAVPVQEIREGATGALMRTIDRSDVRARYGAAYYMVHRADLHAMLVEALRAIDPDAILTGQKLASLEVKGDGVTLAFENGTARHADVLVAADGARSLVRSLVFGADKAEFTGHVAWRFLVPADKAPVEASEPGSRVWTGPERSFVRYAVREGQLINCVGLTRTGLWRGEGWSQMVPASEMVPEFEGFVAEVTGLMAAAPGGMVNSWGLFVRPMAARFVKGPVLLLGDAAHPMLPFMGQGAAMAMEDGVVLGRCFAASATAAEAMARYEAARLERCRFVLEESALGADRIQQAGADARRLARNEDSLGIFDYDPATVPV
jgi:salicylate hydroxylase